LHSKILVFDFETFYADGLIFLDYLSRFFVAKVFSLIRHLSVYLGAYLATPRTFSFFSLLKARCALDNFFSEERKKRGLSILFPSERKEKFSIPRSIPTHGTSAVGSGLVSTSQENEICHSSDGTCLT